MFEESILLAVAVGCAVAVLIYAVLRRFGDRIGDGRNDTGGSTIPPRRLPKSRQ